MDIFTERASPRNDCEAPIMCASLNADNYFSAHMCNCSMDGMYFETDRALCPDSDIWIKMVNYIPGSCGPEAYRSYLVNVRWCNKIAKTDSSGYGVGVQYLIKSRVDHGVTACGQTYFCSLCDKKIPFGEIYETDRCVYLCSGCLKHMEQLPCGSSKSCITNFMIGNVL